MLSQLTIARRHTVRERERKKGMKKGKDGKTDKARKRSEREIKLPLSSEGRPENLHIKQAAAVLRELEREREA